MRTLIAVLAVLAGIAAGNERKDLQENKKRACTFASWW